MYDEVGPSGRSWPQLEQIGSIGRARLVVTHHMAASFRYMLDRAADRTLRVRELGGALSRALFVKVSSIQ